MKSRALLCAVLVVAACIFGALMWAAHRTSGVPHVERPAAAAPLGTPTPTVPLSDLQGEMTYTRNLQAIAVGDLAVALAQAELDAFLASLAPPPAPSAPQTAAPSAPRSGGARSLAWWQAIATCESGWPTSGPENSWRTGHFGLEAGYPIGHLSWDEQLAWAQRIYAQYGDGAWGCSPVAWRNVPGG